MTKKGSQKLLILYHFDKISAKPISPTAVVINFKAESKIKQLFKDYDIFYQCFNFTGVEIIKPHERGL